MSKNLLVDILSVLTRDHEIGDLKAQLGDCCDFREHRSDDERRTCKNGQSCDGQFYTSFLRVYLDGVDQDPRT
jgi:hypothetical protein